MSCPVFAYHCSKIKGIQRYVSILGERDTLSYFVFDFEKLVKKLVRDKVSKNRRLQLYIINVVQRHRQNFKSTLLLLFYCLKIYKWKGKTEYVQMVSHG